MENLLNQNNPGLIPSCLIVAAHPDDETVSASCLLSRNPDMRIVHLTDGAPRDLADARANGLQSWQEYAQLRRWELEQALSLAGIRAEQLHELNLPDQEAALHLVSVTRTLIALITKYQPEVIVTHPYEGGHPDHDSAAFAVHGARYWLMRNHGRAPDIAEMASYHDSEGGIARLEFLPGGADAQTIELSASHRELKARMIACFASQRQTLDPFPVDHERFRPARDYDFRQLPNNGSLLYERFPWGMSGRKWLTLTAAALDELAIAI